LAVVKLSDDWLYSAAPSTSPRDVTPDVVNSNPTSVAVNWQPPHHANGPLTGMSVYHLSPYLHVPSTRCSSLTVLSVTKQLTVVLFFSLTEIVYHLSYIDGCPQV